MTLYTKTLLCTLIFSLFMLGACQKRVDKPANTKLPQSMQLGVVGFTQPVTTSALITGSLPFKQGFIKNNELKTLDSYLKTELDKNLKSYIVIPVTSEATQINFYDSQNPQGLSKWLAFGKMHNIDMLLVPQVINWHERDGSQIGVDSSAHVRIELYLLDIKNDKIYDSAFFEEKQVGLVDDILKVGSFLKRNGAWITATEMSQEAIIKTVKELNL